MIQAESRGALWGVKQGRFCHFAFSLVLQCLGVLIYPDAGKNIRKRVTVAPPFICAPNASKTKGLRAVAPNASRQSTGQMANRPHFTHIQEVPVYGQNGGKRKMPKRPCFTPHLCSLRGVAGFKVENPVFGSCNRTLLRRVLRRFFKRSAFLEGFLEGTSDKGFQ